MPSRRRAFTLVELLVVVGIMAVLIALLVPALAVAREHANRVACAANLRSMGQALMMYTQRWACYPGMQSLPDDGQHGWVAAWPVLLREYMGGSRKAFYCPSQDERCRWDGDGPDERADGFPYRGARADGPYLVLGYEPGERLLHPAVYFSYSYNSSGVGPANNQFRGLGVNAVTGPDPVFIFPPELRGRSVGRVKEPADMIAVTDSNGDGVQDFSVSGRFSTLHPLWWAPGRLHRGVANALFCDGHVAWYRQEELFVEILNFTTPVDPLKARRWNYDHEP